MVLFDADATLSIVIRVRRAAVIIIDPIVIGRLAAIRTAACPIDGSASSVRALAVRIVGFRIWIACG